MHEGSADEADEAEAQARADATGLQAASEWRSTKAVAHPCPGGTPRSGETCRHAR